MQELYVNVTALKRNSKCAKCSKLMNINGKPACFWQIDCQLWRIYAKGQFPGLFKNGGHINNEILNEALKEQKK